MWTSRKSKTLITLLLFVLITAHLVTGCTNNTRPRSLSDMPPSFTRYLLDTHHPVQTQLIIGTIHIEPSRIAFSGGEYLDEGMVLHSQLYEEDKPLTWWPADEDIIVQNGKWNISVALGKNSEVKTLFFGPMYYLKIWQEDNPANFRETGFSLGDPPLTPWWRQGILWLVTGIVVGCVAVTTGVYAIVRRRHRVKTKSA